MSEDIYVVAKYDYDTTEPQELSFKKNDRFKLIDDSKNWWKVSFSIVRPYSKHFRDIRKLRYIYILGSNWDNSMFRVLPPKGT